MMPRACALLPNPGSILPVANRAPMQGLHRWDCCTNPTDIVDGQESDSLLPDEPTVADRSRSHRMTCQHPVWPPSAVFRRHRSTVTPCSGHGRPRPIPRRGVAVFDERPRSSRNELHPGRRPACPPAALAATSHLLPAHLSLRHGLRAPRIGPSQPQLPVEPCPTAVAPVSRSRTPLRNGMAGPEPPAAAVTPQQGKSKTEEPHAGPRQTSWFLCFKLDSKDPLCAQTAPPRATRCSYQ